VSLSVHYEQCQVDCLSVLFLDIYFEFQTKLLWLCLALCMIFVMIFKTLQHGILANKDANPPGRKSALYFFIYILSSLHVFINVKTFPTCMDLFKTIRVTCLYIVCFYIKIYIGTVCRGEYLHLFILIYFVGVNASFAMHVVFQQSTVPLVPAHYFNIAERSSIYYPPLNFQALASVIVYCHIVQLSTMRRSKFNFMDIFLDELNIHPRTLLPC